MQEAWLRVDRADTEEVDNLTAFSGDKITEIDVIADPERLRELELAVLDS